MRQLSGRRSVAVAVALAAGVALASFLLLRDGQPRTIVLEDFESGALSDWQAVENGAGAWSVAAGPASGFRARFGIPAPPGKFAILTDLHGPGTRILYRDLRLDGRFILRMTVFYATQLGFSHPRTLAHDEAEQNQQFRSISFGPRRRSTPLRGEMCWSTSFARHRGIRPSPPDEP